MVLNIHRNLFIYLRERFLHCNSAAPGSPFTSVGGACSVSYLRITCCVRFQGMQQLKTKTEEQNPSQCCYYLMSRCISVDSLYTEREKNNIKKSHFVIACDPDSLEGCAMTQPSYFTRNSTWYCSQYEGIRQRGRFRFRFEVQCSETGVPHDQLSPVIRSYSK